MISGEQLTKDDYEFYGRPNVLPPKSCDNPDCWSGELAMWHSDREVSGFGRHKFHGLKLPENRTCYLCLACWQSL